MNDTSPPPIDTAYLRDVCGDDRELGVELFGDFETETRANMMRLRGAIAAANPVEAREAAHGIKGGAGSLGFTEISQCAARIENAARDGSLVDAPAQLQQLTEALARLGSAFPKISWD